MKNTLFLLLFLTGCEWSPYYGDPGTPQDTEAQNRCLCMCRSDFVWCRQDPAMNMQSCSNNQERCFALCKIK